MRLGERRGKRGEKLLLLLDEMQRRAARRTRAETRQTRQQLDEALDLGACGNPRHAASEQLHAGREGQAAGEALHLLLHEPFDLGLGVVVGGGDEVLEDLRLLWLQKRRIDPDPSEIALAVHGQDHEAAAGLALDPGALHLVKKKEQLLAPLAAALTEAHDRIVTCEICGNIDTVSPCTLCRDQARDRSLICVVEEVGDLWALERANVLNGLYHVLGGTLSPLDGVGPEDLSIAKLIERAGAPEVKEVLLALNATVEGQSTAHYLTDQLAGCNVTISRLAHGVPIGGELDYLDEGTLAAAVKARKTM